MRRQDLGSAELWLSRSSQPRARGRLMATEAVGRMAHSSKASNSSFTDCGRSGARWGCWPMARTRGSRGGDFGWSQSERRDSNTLCAAYPCVPTAAGAPLCPGQKPPMATRSFLASPPNPRGGQAGAQSCQRRSQRSSRSARAATHECRGQRESSVSIPFGQECTTEFRRREARELAHGPRRMGLI